MHGARRLRRWFEAARARRSERAPQVRVVHWGGGLVPAPVVVKADRPIRLVFERLGAGSAADSVAIPALGWVTTLDCAARNAVDLRPCPVGSYRFSSVDGALSGFLVVLP
ncbi:MAG TPA: cupredoxin domain-containing protein [Solirubrobacteraceae bacterium]|nr:cupredoxin domain-containing protein [Solirubrobacteraceae bacterium]